MTETFKDLDKVPEFIFKAKAEELHKYTDNLSLYFIEGKKQPPLFISVLLHGNEHSGWRAMQEIFNTYRDKKLALPRSIIFLIGNVRSAASRKRCLDGGHDLNRIWLSEDKQNPYARARKIAETVFRLKPFLCVDIHNTSGRNIHYSCVPGLNTEHLQLARIFSRVVVSVKKPDTTLMNCMAKIAPSVTLECGQSLEPAGIEHAKEFIEACLNLSSLPTKDIAPHDLMLLETVATIYVNDDVNFCFANEANKSQADLVLRSDLDALNFSEVEKGEYLGHYRKKDVLKLVYADDGRENLCHLSYDNGQIKLSEDAYFAMLSTDTDVIKKDCLGYLMAPVRF